MNRKPFLIALAELMVDYRPRFNRGERRWLRMFLPSPGNVVFTTLMIALLLWVQTAGAVPLPATHNLPLASTGTIAYQGRLADSGGSPITATVGMIFRLYNVPTGGVHLWQEDWTGSNSVRVSDGLFNVMLGSLTTIPQSVITGNDNLWLGITVGSDDEMVPRVQLGSVPWAVQALTVPDGSITAAKLASGVSLEPPDGSITTVKIADGAVTSAKATGFVTAIGANLLLQWGTRTAVTGTSTPITFAEPFSATPAVVATADTVGGQNVTVNYVSASQFKVEIPNTGGNVAIN